MAPSSLGIRGYRKEGPVVMCDHCNDIEVSQQEVKQGRVGVIGAVGATRKGVVMYDWAGRQ